MRHRWAIIIAAIGFVVLAGLFGGDVQSHLKSGGFEASDAESARASTLLEHEFGAGDPDVVMVITARQGNVDDPEVAAAARELASPVAGEPRVAQVSPKPLRRLHERLGFKEAVEHLDAGDTPDPNARQPAVLLK